MALLDAMSTKAQRAFFGTGACGVKSLLPVDIDVGTWVQYYSVSGWTLRISWLGADHIPEAIVVIVMVAITFSKVEDNFDLTDARYKVRHADIYQPRSS